MEEGTKTKKTVFVGGVADEVDESAIVQAFQPFGQSSRCLRVRRRLIG